MEIRTYSITKIILSVIVLVTFVYSEEKVKTKEDLALAEDILILQKSIEKFGPPQPYKRYKLPGPDVKVDTTLEENLLQGNSKNFTFRLRTISEDYSFIEHYETTEVRINNGKTLSTIRGQVSEEISRKSGGFYLRTIGYIFDEHGFQNFLIDITKIEKIFIEPPTIAPLNNFDQQQRISPSVLHSLSGAVLG